MAVPRVFVSSTCYDLSEVREALKKFIEDFGFDAVLSEYGNVFYHPDLHTHESCLHEIANCQILILIIGGRFGGEYVLDKSKSVTNAEYLAAVEESVPIFAFVKSEVLHDERVYKFRKNKVKDIDFPSVEKQEHAESIFTFIDEVRKATKNNGFFPFDRAQDLIEILRKQWAAMVFEFLNSRKLEKQLSASNRILNELARTSDKLEDLVKRIYTKVAQASGNESEAESVFLQVEALDKANSFFSSLFEKYRLNQPEPIERTVEELRAFEYNENSWTKFLEFTGLFEVQHMEVLDGSKDVIKVLMRTPSEFGYELNRLEYLSDMYEDGLKKLSPLERPNLILRWFVAKQADTQQPPSA